jgi:catechol 2,3-dioxygenase-like lactoylglutathione lyase family enzyme
MISVCKIAHATYEMPDLQQQVDYYTNILGLTLAGREKEAAFLGLTVDHHSVVLRKADAANCVGIGFQISSDDDLNDYEKQIPGARHQDAAQERRRAQHHRHGHLRRSEGNDDRGVQAG